MPTPDPFTDMRKEDFNFLVVLILLAVVTFGVGTSFGYYLGALEASDTVKQVSR